MSDLDVALAALRSDATAWRTAADNLEEPRSAIGSLGLTGADVSMWAVDRGLDQTYNDARATLQNLLDQAARSFRSLGDSLTAAADTYQREEEANLHTFSSIHQGVR